jgi:hypothetical protein
MRSDFPVALADVLPLAYVGVRMRLDLRACEPKEIHRRGPDSASGPIPFRSGRQLLKVVMSLPGAQP